MDANQHDKDRRDFRAMAMTLSLIFSNLLFVLMNKIDRLSNFGQRKEMRVPSLANWAIGNNYKSRRFGWKLKKKKALR